MLLLDDTTLAVDRVEKLNELMYFFFRKLKINVSRSELMIYNTSKGHDLLRVKLNGEMAERRMCSNLSAREHQREKRWT